MSKSVKYLIALLIALAAVSAIAVVFTAAHRPDADDQDEDEAVKAPSRVVVQNGETVIRLDEQAQAREGIRVAPVAQTSMRSELRATAVLLAVNDLVTARDSYVAAQAKLQRDQQDLSLTRSQAERTSALYQQNQNMSLQAMQSADAAYRNAQAQLAADEQDARLQLDAVRQRWGTVVANWISGDSPALEAVLAQRAFLLQVILPPGEADTKPAKLSLTLPANKLVPARLVSSLPLVNPQIQGISYLYVAGSAPGMAAGMNLSVLIPVGRPLAGTVVPENAIVWWQGKAWAYQQTSASSFTRREVPTGNPVRGGYFVPGKTFAPAAKLVTAGPQALLSEEFRSHIQQED